MKKYLTIIVSVIFVLILSFSYSTFADDTDGGILDNDLYGSSEASEMLIDMDLITSWIDYFGINQENIDLNKAVRVYPDVYVFSEEVNNRSEMINLLTDRDYVYVIPVDTTETWYSVAVAKGKKIYDYTGLEEEVIKSLEAKIGRWFVSELIEYDDQQDDMFEDYQKKINTFCELYGIEGSETFFIGGTTKNSTSIAVCFPDDDSQGAYYIAMDEFPLNPQSIDEIQGAVYTFDEMKEYAYELTSEEYESTGVNDDETIFYGGMSSTHVSAKHTTSPWLYVVIAIVICAAAAVTVIIIRKHRSKA